MHLVASTAIPNGVTYTYWVIGLIFTALSVAGSPFVVKVWKHVRRRNQKIDALYEAIVGKPSSIEEPSPAPGLIERLDNLEAAVAALKREVTPNGGQTNRLGDRVRRTEEAISALAEQLPKA